MQRNFPSSTEANGHSAPCRSRSQTAKLSVSSVSTALERPPPCASSPRENLVATAANYGASADPWTLARVIDFFPRLGERLDNQGGQLSGGEQQMLAIGRALMLNPRLLILDEATEGLAPLIRQEIWRRLEQLKQSGLTILLIDKNIDEFSHIADRHYIVEKGQVVWQGNSSELGADGELKARYLGI